MSLFKNEMVPNSALFSPLFLTQDKTARKIHASDSPYHHRLPREPYHLQQQQQTYPHPRHPPPPPPPPLHHQSSYPPYESEYFSPPPPHPEARRHYLDGGGDPYGEEDEEDEGDWAPPQEPRCDIKNFPPHPKSFSPCRMPSSRYFRDPMTSGYGEPQQRRPHFVGRPESPPLHAAGGMTPPRTPSPPMQQPHHRRQAVSAAGASRRRGGGRRLPATPSQPSTLNIDSLANISLASGSSAGRGQRMDGGNLQQQQQQQGLSALPINFPKLNPSPSRGSLGGGYKGGQQQMQQHQPGGTRLPDVPLTGGGGGRVTRFRQQGRWSRSLDDPNNSASLSFEEAVMAGRGTRQLPVAPSSSVGAGAGGPPSSSLGVGRGRGGGGGGARRELPRPGTTIGFANSPAVAPGGYPLQQPRQPRRMMDESDEEDWC